DQQKQSSESGFLHEKSSNNSETHTTTIPSILEATGKIDMMYKEMLRLLLLIWFLVKILM
ncbi:hypothetical protein, partial [Bartonella sp. CL74QHWL]|uniref:hypothetical protein n=1 Tax=Bartonella sp. CL74QHWL TaxID=3243541 RepID=UPI0035CFC4DA